MQTAKNASWTGEFIEQITMFPAARHDDMCDVVSQAAAWLQENRAPSLVIFEGLLRKLLHEFY